MLYKVVQHSSESLLFAKVPVTHIQNEKGFFKKSSQNVSYHSNHNVCLFVFYSLRSSQQCFSHVGMGLPEVEPVLSSG